MPKKLYAKDRRRQLNRRAGTGILTVLGLGVGGWLVDLAWSKIRASRVMPPGERRDWSGCGTPPADVQPGPRYRRLALIVGERTRFTRVRDVHEVLPIAPEHLGRVTRGRFGKRPSVRIARFGCIDLG
jgi:hypothetical protein